MNSSSLEKSISFAKNIENIYSHSDSLSFHYMNPYPKYSNFGIVSAYKRFAHHIESNFYAYFSDNFTSILDPEYLSHLHQIDNCVGVKYSSSSATRMASAASHQRHDFDVFPAVIKTLAGNLGFGFKSSTTVEACLFCPQIIEVFNAQNNVSRAAESQMKLNKLMLNFKSSASVDNYISVPEMKYVLKQLDVCEDFHSLVLRPLSSEEKKHLDGVIEQHKQHLRWLQD